MSTGSAEVRSLSSGVASPTKQIRDLLVSAMVERSSRVDALEKLLRDANGEFVLLDIGNRAGIMG
jgi:hypothetical protein